MIDETIDHTPRATLFTGRASAATANAWSKAPAIGEGDLPDHVRLVLRWVAAGDTIVCTGLADLLEAVREAAFDEGFIHPLTRATTRWCTGLGSHPSG